MAATKEFLTITERAEKDLRTSIIEQLKLIIKEFKNLTNFPEKKDYKLILDVFSYNEQVNKLNDKSINKSIENFMKAPLGKDLRRNVSYLMIVRSLRDISKDATGIAKYINDIHGLRVNKK
jgi:phosphate uptake regulator